MLIRLDTQIWYYVETRVTRIVIIFVHVTDDVLIVTQFAWMLNLFPEVWWINRAGR